MARVRSRFHKRTQRAAYKFLARAAKNASKVSSRGDAAWIKAANLEPILNFLAK